MSMSVFVAVKLHHDLAVGTDMAAVHPLAVERRDEVAGTIERDDATLSPLSHQLAHDDAVGRRGERLSAVEEAGADVIRDHVAHEELPHARGRHRAVRARVGAGPDDRRVADPTPAFVRDSPGRGASGKASGLVPGHRTDRAVYLRRGPGAL